MLDRRRQRSSRTGKKYGVDYAEAFHYIGNTGGQSAVETYVERNAVSIGK